MKECVSSVTSNIFKKKLYEKDFHGNKVYSSLKCLNLLDKEGTIRLEKSWCNKSLYLNIRVLSILMQEIYSIILFTMMKKNYIYPFQFTHILGQIWVRNLFYMFVIFRQIFNRDRFIATFNPSRFISIYNINLVSQ